LHQKTRVEKVTGNFDHYFGTPPTDGETTMRKCLLAKSLHALALLLAGVLFSGVAVADWPDRPVTLIVPYGAGGGTDATGRIIANMLEKEYGKPFNVVNRTGGGGVVGHTAIANSKPDGYTLGLATSSLTTFEWFGSSKVTYRDFTPIAMYNVDPTTILVKSDSPFGSIADVLAAIKANPGKHSMATPVGAGHHLSFSALLDASGIDPNSIKVVPVKGGAMILQELAAGGVDIGPSTLPEAKSLMDAGKLRPLVVLAPERSDSNPNVPTVNEATGLDVVGGTWRSVVGPKGMPDAVVEKLASSMEKIYADPDFKSQMAKLGYGLRYAKGQEFTDFMATMHASNGVLLKKLGLIE
jgi:tripartite-type tricarboxylate transporter receptor subunit TctC